MILGVSFVVLIIGCLILIFSNYNDVLTDIGILMIIISLISGFFVFGIVIPVNTELTKVEQYEVVKTPYSVILDTEYGAKILTNMKYSDIDKGDINVYLEQRYNSYGFRTNEEGEHIKVELKE